MNIDLDFPGLRQSPSLLGIRLSLAALRFDMGIRRLARVPPADRASHRRGLEALWQARARAVCAAAARHADGGGSQAQCDLTRAARSLAEFEAAVWTRHAWLPLEAPSGYDADVLRRARACAGAVGRADVPLWRAQSPARTAR